jgi:hypothetical protein
MMNKKAGLPQATLTTVALGSPAVFSGRPVTFCPSLARGLALVLLQEHYSTNQDSINPEKYSENQKHIFP